MGLHCLKGLSLAKHSAVFILNFSIIYDHKASQFHLHQPCKLHTGHAKKVAGLRRHWLPSLLPSCIQSLSSLNCVWALESRECNSGLLPALRGDFSLGWNGNEVRNQRKVKPHHAQAFGRQITDFPSSTETKNLPAKAGDMGSIPGLGRSHRTWSN